jgi:two-component system cell cycle sensor histidine kinase/response regulator CckA
VQRAGGKIFLDSRAQRGSTFSVYLPACERPAAIRVDAPSAADFAPRDEMTLVVEDESQVRKVTADMLRSRGYTVIEATDGPEAIEEFERCGGQVDFVLTDVRMPLMRGPELVRRLRELDARLKVVYMSGYYHQDDEVLAGRFDTLGTGLVRKPFRPTELERKLREVLDAGTL